jgi:NIMA (never in mitosis gene a)-related kinase 1/4/5
MSLTDFEIISKLGDGAFSSVFKVMRKSDGQQYALKKVKLGALKQKEKENALNEVRILASVSHPNIIAYMEAFIDEPTNTLCIVMELAESGDLLKKISTHKAARTYFPENEVWTTLVHVTQGLKVLHDAKILHRDLKCANIFISKDGTMKLGDLNVSKVNKRGLAYTQTGTPYYASPEVWKDQPYNSSSDIWSLGCVIYEMAALVPPFTASDMQGLYKKIIRGVYPNISSQYSADLSNVIRTLLQVNPTLRPSCDKILEMPPVQRHISIQLMPNPQSADLLGTIKFEPGIKNLKQKLPAPKYDSRNRGLSAHSARPKVEECQGKRCAAIWRGTQARG